MKKAKWALVCLMLVCVLALGGCRLALDERTASRDRLVGMSVLLGDIDSLSTKDGEYFDRRQPHEPDGELLMLGFGTLENGDLYVDSEHSEWFSDVHMSSHVKDDGEERSIEATLYLSGDLDVDSSVMLSMEHVYQREDGTLYAVDGGSNYSGAMDGLGLKISETHTETDVNRKKTSVTTTIRLNVEYDEPTVSAVLVEMRGTDETLGRHELTGQEEIWISSHAEWAMIEETLEDGTVCRTALNGPLDGEHFEIRTVNDSGVCVPHGYTVRVSGIMSDQALPR